jgi:hypothetical protein
MNPCDIGLQTDDGQAPALRVFTELDERSKKEVKSKKSNLFPSGILWP